MNCLKEGETMIDDPIVEEVDKRRERLLAQFGIEGLLREFRAIEDEMRDRVVRLEPRPPRRTTREP
jgi:hypothetical protein